MGSFRESPWVRFGFPGLLAGLALAALVGGWQAPEAHGQLAPGANLAAGAEGSGTIAFTSPGPGMTQFLYMVDTKAQSFAVYRVDSSGSKGSVKLEAARHYRWDLKLAEYNNQPPEVGAVESMVRTTTSGAR